MRFRSGLDRPLFFIAGPCVVESRQLAFDTAGELKEITRALGIPFIYKSSYDKANRSSIKSFRGLGMDKGLEILGEVGKEIGVPVLTDVHEIDEIDAAAAVVDVLQTPAFLCRQTDFISRRRRGGQAGEHQERPVSRARRHEERRRQSAASGTREPSRRSQAGERIMVCERGASFGYNNLVSDMRSLAIMRETGCPVVFDATHSVQLPGGQGSSSGGQREFVPVLARAAVASGVAGVFMETHPNPRKGAVGRTERVAAQAHESAAGDAQGARQGGEARRIRRGRLSRRPQLETKRQA